MGLGTWTFQTASTGYPIGALTYREYQDSGEVTYNEQGVDAHRIFQVDWDQNEDFVSDVLGWSKIVAGGSGVSREIPDAHPDFPLLYAYSVHRKPETGQRATVAGATSNWQIAKIDVGYRSVDYFVLADDPEEDNELYRFVSRKTLPKGDYLQLALNSFAWVSRPQINGQPQVLGVSPGIIVPARTLEYTWHAVPSLAAGFDPNAPLRCPTEDTILSLLGTTNSEVFDSIYPVGTVLFVGAEASIGRPIPFTQTTGQYQWTIKYYFECKDHGLITEPPFFGEEAGVNWLYDPVFKRWDLVTDTGGVAGQTLYNYNDLNDLFTL